MVQTLRSITIPAGRKIIIIEKPLALRRIFFGVCAFAPQSSWYASQISFGDPTFRSYYVLGGPVNCFEARGEGIFQGDVWVRNVSSIDILYAFTEILV